MLDDGAKIFKCHKSIRETLTGFFWRSSSIRLFIYFFIIFGCLKEHFEQFKSSGDLKEETRDASWSLGRGPRWHTISLKTENQTAPFETMSNKKDLQITGVRRRTSQSRKKTSESVRGSPRFWEESAWEPGVDGIAPVVLSDRIPTFGSVDKNQLRRTHMCGRVLSYHGSAAIGANAIGATHHPCRSCLSYDLLPRRPWPLPIQRREHYASNIFLFGLQLISCAKIPIL